MSRAAEAFRGRFAPYGAGARWYDLLSMEGPIYGVGRRAGIALLAVGPGDHVLDVGCGTGLSLALLRAAVGPTGRVTGVDASASMLDQARARVRRDGLDGVSLVHADAGTGPPGSPTEPWVDSPVDAVLFAYSLSVIPGWREALETAVVCARPGARLAVVDLALPTGGMGVPAALARLACAAGGSDPGRHPWTAVAERVRQPRHVTFRRGHIHAVGGRLS